MQHQLRHDNRSLVKSPPRTLSTSDDDEIISDTDTSTITEKSSTQHNTDTHLNLISDHIQTASGPQVPLSTDKQTIIPQNSVFKENPLNSVSNFSSSVSTPCIVTPSTQKYGIIMSTIPNNTSSLTQTHPIHDAALTQPPTTTQAPKHPSTTLAPSAKHQTHI